MKVTGILVWPFLIEKLHGTQKTVISAARAIYGIDSQFQRLWRHADHTHDHVHIIYGRQMTSSHELRQQEVELRLSHLTPDTRPHTHAEGDEGVGMKSPIRVSG